MTFDELQKKWTSQQTDSKLTIDGGLLLKEVKRNKEQFESTVFWRDMREILIGIAVAVFFMYHGLKSSTWPLIVLAMLVFVVVVFMIVDRALQKNKRPKYDETLRCCIKSSLTEVNHQIWLLQKIFWWYLLPPGIGIVLFWGYIALQMRMIESFSQIKHFLGLALPTFVFLGVYWLNQWAVRKELLPRKTELEKLQHSLENSDVTLDKM